jgi:hypothetical protein
VNLLQSLAFVCLWTAIAIAVLKYRLYEIDQIISRTLAYAIVTGLLVGVYADLVLLATQVLSLHTPVAVAASTLAAAALFNPLRRRVQQLVDRRFNRARHGAGETIAASATSLKDERGPGLSPRRPGRCRAPSPGTRSRLGADQAARVGLLRSFSPLPGPGAWRADASSTSHLPPARPRREASQPVVLGKSSMIVQSCRRPRPMFQDSRRVTDVVKRLGIGVGKHSNTCLQRVVAAAARTAAS